MFTKTNSTRHSLFKLNASNTAVLYKTSQKSLYKIESLGDITGLTTQTLAQDTFALTKCTDNMKLTGPLQTNNKTRSHIATKQTLLLNNLLGSYAPFIKTFIIRGIGYQVDIIENEQSMLIEFPYNRYLSLRVGHSFLVYKPIPNYIGVKVSHKDRKLVIYGANKEQVSNFAKVIFKLRPPSVYTGRGIRIKKGLHRRKLGKKDIRKGKV